MKNISLSTMWSLNYESVTDFMQDVREFGFTHLELNSSLGPKNLADLLSIQDLKISSVHAPCPNIQTDAGYASSLSLASLNEDERHQAVKVTKDTIDLAYKVGAGVVVIHAGYVDMNHNLEHDLRKLYSDGLADSSEFKDLQSTFVNTREFMVPPHLNALSVSLLELIDYARERGMKLGLENRVHYYEIPILNEMLYILSEHGAEVVGYWHDVGHAEILERIGFNPHEEWMLLLDDRMIGIHLHDVNGISDHNTPGTGDMDWHMVAVNLPDDVIKVCEIGKWNDVEDVRQVVPFLQRKGII